MKFLVEGKEFDNFEEAQKYEEELNLSLKKKEYFDFIVSHMSAYICKCHTGEEVVFVFITEGDASKYAQAMAGTKYGVEFSIDDNNQVVTNWELLTCDDRFSYTLARHIVGDCPELSIPVEVIQTVDFDQYLGNNEKAKQASCKCQEGNCHDDFFDEDMTALDLINLLLFND